MLGHMPWSNQLSHTAYVPHGMCACRPFNPLYCAWRVWYRDEAWERDNKEGNQRITYILLPISICCNLWRNLQVLFAHSTGFILLWISPFLEQSSYL